MLNRTIENDSPSEIRSFFRGSFLSYLTGLYILVWYLQLSKRVSILGDLRFEFVFGSILTVLSIFTLLKNSNASGKLNTGLVRSAFWLIFVLGLYVVFSVDRSHSFDIFVDRVLKFSALALFITASVKNVHDLRVVVSFMLLAWLKLASEGFLGWATGSMVWFNQGIPRLHGTTGVLFHPNSFSGFAVGCLPFCIFLLGGGIKNILAKIGILALLVFSIIIVINTGSRTGYVAVLLGGLYFFLRLKKNKLKIALVSVVALIALIQIIPEFYKERFVSIFTLEEAEGDSSGARIQIIKDATDIVLSYPLGVGLNAFPIVREEVFGRFQDTHNLYLEVVTNTGPLGLFVFLYFVYKLIQRNSINIKIGRALISERVVPSLDVKFCISIAYATNGFILMRLLLGLFGMDLFEIYWWLALGLTLSVSSALVGLERKSAAVLAGETDKGRARLGAESNFY